MTQQLNEIMSTKVVSINPTQSVQEAATLMKDHNIGSIPVVENGVLLGIITDRDLVLRSTSLGQNTTMADDESYGR